MNFFKTFLASCLGSLLAFIVLIGLIIFSVTALVSSLSNGDSQTTIKENSVLHLKLDVPITENEIENPFEGLPIPGAVSSIGLLPLKKSIEQAKQDPSIKGIYLDLSVFMGGFGVAREIRQALLDFKTSGKWIVAYSELYTESAYYVVSAADKVYLNPEGDLEFNGLSVEVSFFKKLFDKLEIKPQIFRVGDFKSAVEPFMLDHMSAENKLQLNELISDINNSMIRDIAQSRNIEVNRLKEISDKMLVTNSTTAVAQGLVDSLIYFDQVQKELRTRLGAKENSDISFVKYSKYKKSYSTYTSSKNEIAVIVADGDIIPGKAQQGMIGSDTFAEEIRKARLDDGVKAIVIRINSPGGSALASDVMWREVKLATEVKPVIASMSDYAASGGYYLAMACDTIVAQPTTITGSIGVFSVLFDLSSFLDNKLGITFEEVKTGDIGGLSVTRPLTAVEKSIWQKRTEDIYGSFTTKAAEGRGMPVEELRKVASGRVWTGAQAKERGLVDVLGNFNDAVAIATAKAGVSNDYKLKYYPVQKSFIQEWLTGMEENAETKALKETLGNHYGTYQQLKKLKSLQGVQTRMPFELIIE
ncbi:MAG: signal peptide peptidase SppA [Cyclobacteriaceae bacterium]|jgi:protease IV|nr:signal peptide peptidase SppA [Cyclobacteriaceae bacterium]